MAIKLIPMVGALLAAASAHEPITTNLTWSKEISRVVYQHCAACHRPEGRAMSLLTYKDARPWAKAIRDEVLNRRMPPWDAVKGVGEFRDDLSLSQPEMDLLVSWVEGGAPEGNPIYLPPARRAQDASPPSREGNRGTGHFDVERRDDAERDHAIGAGGTPRPTARPVRQAVALDSHFPPGMESDVRVAHAPPLAQRYEACGIRGAGTSSVRTWKVEIARLAHFVITAAYLWVARQR